MGSRTESSIQDSASHMRMAPVADNRHAVVLAGGDGRRLESFVRRLRGDALPKQYVSLYGSQSLLERTYKRVERLVPPERIMTVVTRDHFRHDDACHQLARRPMGTVIAQPQNRDTAPGLLLPLTYLAKQAGDCVVAVFPSDHNVTNDRVLMQHVAAAFRVVERQRELVVLLGGKPDRSETDYGYVVPGAGLKVVGGSGVYAVRGFVEKPSLRRADELVRQGALWNTAILVFRLQRFLDLMWRLTPFLPLAFTEIANAIGTPEEHEVIDTVYRSLPPTNLSRGILELMGETSPACLAVLRVDGTSWSDWGVEQRVMRDLRAMGVPERRAAL